MSIKIEWGAGNTGADEVTVYRSLTPIDLSALPAALATVPGGNTSYTDTTAARNTVYNYVTAIKKGNDVMLSQNKTYGHFPDTGPGPNTLLRGTYHTGYFGRMTAAEFFTNQEILSALMASVTANTTAQFWHKFIVDGKILFMPELCIGMTVPGAIYNSGLMHGTDDTGLTPYPGKSPWNTAGVNQRKTIVKSGYTYVVRLPKASTLSTDQIVLAYDPATMPDSEWGRTMGRIFTFKYTNATRSRWGDLVYMPSAGFGCHLAFTQHSAGGNNLFVMGDTTRPDGVSMVNYGTGSYNWRPVFELVL